MNNALFSLINRELASPHTREYRGDKSAGATRSPSYKPMTPTSLPSPYSPYPYYTSHPRSDAGAQPVTEPRQGSPSNSITSSVSIAGAPFEGGPIRTSTSIQHQTPTPRVKHKKQRLCNAQRKDICLYAEQNPNARQEDMAMRRRDSRPALAAKGRMRA